MVVTCSASAISRSVSVAKFAAADYKLGLIIYYEDAGQTSYSYHELGDRFSVVKGKVDSVKRAETFPTADSSAFDAADAAGAEEESQTDEEFQSFDLGAALEDSATEATEEPVETPAPYTGAAVG